MPNVRPLNEKKYGITKYEFRAAYNFCLQYKDWVKDLDEITLIKSPNMSGDEIKVNDNSSAVERLAMKRMHIVEKIQKVERAAEAAVEGEMELYMYLMMYVTTEGATYDMVKQKGIPCGASMFYKIRRRFYYIIAKGM